MANIDDIEEIIIKIKDKRRHWKLSPRPKNYKTLSALNTDENDIFDEIYKKISPENYSSGPLLDNHTPPIKGNIWIFGLRLHDADCYLKFQDKPIGIIMWISIHEQEYPLELPYMNRE